MGWVASPGNGVHATCVRMSGLYANFQPPREIINGNFKIASTEMVILNGMSCNNHN